MTTAEMHRNVNLLLDKINSMQADMILPQEIDMALDMAQLAFVKQRFQKANKYGAGFEESQKRIDDLAPLIRTATISIDAKPFTWEPFDGDNENFPNASQIVLTGDKTLWRDVYRISTSDDTPGAQALQANGPGADGDRIDPYMFMISVRARVNYKGCKSPLENGVDYSLQELGDNMVVARRSQEIITGFGTSLNNKVVKCKYVQNDDIFTLFEDPFNTATLNGPFYSFSGADEIQVNGQPGSGLTNLEIYTDDTFFTDAVFIRYIKKPRNIQLGLSDCELADHVHIEIVNMAVDILLEGISDPRYKSHQTETLKSD